MGKINEPQEAAAFRKTRATAFTARGTGIATRASSTEFRTRPAVTERSPEGPAPAGAAAS